MTADEIRRLLKGGPGQHAEFLPATASTRRLLETMTAFANGSGGTIILGASHRGLIEGLSASPQRDRDRIVELALAIDPPLRIPMPAIADVDGVQVLTVTVPAGLPHVYAVDGRLVQRRERENAPLTGAALRELLLSREGSTFEAEAVAGATLDHLDLDRVAQHAQAIVGDASDPAHLLVARGCATEVDGRLIPTVAGLLLFGRQPQRFFPSAEILAIRYPGVSMGDDFIKEQIRGPLDDQIQRAAAFVDQMGARASHIEGLRRSEQPPHPPAAVRETIVNAVAHRDYRQRGDAIRLMVFSDRLECYSPGRLPGHVTVSNIVEERFSRNEVIVQVLSEMGYIERLGYGIDRIIRLMCDWHLPSPTFEETPAGFRVTLAARPGAYGPASLSGVVGRQVHLDLNPRQAAALQYLESHDRITNRELKLQHPDVSEETIRRDLADLVARNLLLKIGDKRATFYILK